MYVLYDNIYYVETVPAFTRVKIVWFSALRLWDIGWLEIYKVE